MATTVRRDRADALALSMSKGRDGSVKLSGRQAAYLMDVAEQCGAIGYDHAMYRVGAGGYGASITKYAKGVLCDEDGPAAIWKMIPGRWGAYLVVSPTSWQRV